MKNILLYTFLALAINGYGQNIVCFDIEANPTPNDPAIGSFTKYIDVYGFGIYAEASIPDEKVLHAAAITAELLDNDEDGVVDDPVIHNSLIQREALMPIFAYEGSPGEEAMFDNYQGDGVSAVLYEEEVRPEGSSFSNGFDATIEEILHTINHVGHVESYPAAFAIEPNSNSLMTQAMDVARGGHFESIPANYPDEAWYHYDDFTCDYECMAIEYFYWAITTLMGVQDYPGRCEEIANEWETCTTADFQATDVLMYALLTDPQYKIPMLAPDGNYCPMTIATETVVAQNIQITPNPTSDYFDITLTEAPKKELSIYLFDTTGKKVWSDTLSEQTNQFDVSKLKSGIYLLQIGSDEIVTSKIVIER